MPKKILLIESDGAFAQEVSAALEARGLQARVTGDGKEGVDLARADRPDLIVLSVELPKMSGYSVCNKLKKDDALRTIPLVIVSAEATQDTFEQHRKLKTHAEDYLAKPFSPAALLKRIAALIELPPDGGDSGEDVVTLDDIEVEGLAAAADGASTGAAAEPQDEDLKLLDDAFDSLAVDDSTAMTSIVGAVDAPAATPAPSLPEPPPDAHRLGADADPDAERLGAEADAALAALGEDVGAELDLAEAAALLEQDGPTPSGDDLLRRAGIEPEPPAAAPAPSARAVEAAAHPAPRPEPAAARVTAPAPALERELAAERAARATAEEQARAAAAEAREAAERADREEAARRAGEQRATAAEQRATAAEQRATAAEQRAGDATARAEAAELEAGEVRDGLEAARREVARLGGEAAQARERAEELAKDLQLAQARAGELEAALAPLRQELEAARAELEEARASAASGRADVERALGEREKRVAELEAQNAKHEERVVKAYQKIKGDEKIREKARKALAIALQLLDERAAPATPAAAPGDVQPRRE